ncbi:MAG: type II toxin-antitoxin system MqsA family antitoxin [Acholeplasmataceae bacterium]|jgi:putative zinc finger/helix-turn-helix YgiT family protein|nr:type II toxin-antitoxin system MqsA family antitoxin [Acholeplasmataceae bacterium]
MRKYCGNCEAMHDVIDRKEVREYEIKKTKVSAEITILYCSHCHEEIYDKDIEISNDILLFDTYKKKHNLLTSKEVIRIREKYNLSQATFSKIMGFGIKTITRYENGAIQDNTHDNLLRLVDIEDNFYALWIMNKENLTATENAKITSKFFITALPKTKYEYKELCSSSYTTTIPSNGGFTYDGC